MGRIKGASADRALAGAFALATALVVASASAQPALLEATDIPYRIAVHGIPAERFTLDVYTSPEAQGRPVVIFFHGGGFDRGGKEGVGEKPTAFVAAGYVFIAPNRRYSVMPSADDLDSEVGDSAAAIAWITANADSHGGDPGRIVLMGHSAGAIIATLLATDERYLAAHGLGLADLAAVVAIDTGAYDRVAQAAQAPRSTAVQMYRELGMDDADLARLSPITHVATDKDIPPILLYHRTENASPQHAAEHFAARLREAGVTVEVAVQSDRTHASINRLIGTPGDPVTARILSFIETHTASND